jgi:hypothetical protein
MTALAIERLTKFAGVLPSRGTAGIKANTRVFKGSMVGLDSAGRAMPAGLLAGGTTGAVGKASSTVDNRTGSDLGGSADAADVEIEYGVFAWNNSAAADEIATDDVGKVCYVVDDNTVALTSDTDTRAIAGYVTEVRGDQVYVWMGPHVKGQIVIAAAEASQLDTAQTEIDALQQDVIDRETDAAVGFLAPSLYDFREVTSGGDVGDITANGGVLASDTTPVMRGDANETAEIFWATGNVDAISTQLVLPPDFDGASNVTIDLWVRSGATDAATFTVETGWDGGALVSDSASDAGTKSATLHKITATVAAVDIPNTARLLTIALTPTNAHASDAYSLLGVGINFTRVLTDT